MANAQDHLRFLHAVRRRIIIARLIEAAGIGVGAGSVIVLFIWPAMSMGEKSIVPILAPVFGITILAAIFLVTKHLPDLTQAAREADRQLRLEELLATTLSLRGQDPQWERYVLDAATRKIREFSPGQVIAWRWGLRGWGAIGISAALVMCAVLLDASPAITQAAGTAQTQSVLREDLAQLMNADFPSAAPRADQAEENDRARREVVENAIDPTADRMHVRRADQSNGLQSNSKGAGAASADSSVEPAPIPAFAGEQNKTGTAAGGAAAGENILSGEKTTVAQGTAMNHSSSTLPQPQWGTSVSPDGKVESRTMDVPAEYRDLVREYFVAPTKTIHH